MPRIDRDDVMDIFESTRRYEAWLGGHMPLVAADLALKHARMRLGVFPFMRATFYRWCQQWSAHAGAAGAATRILAVGDLHLENFGTWRDTEGRLVWGINDFDEATRLPWTQDLARLATSAHLAVTAEHLTVRRRDACGAILDGYREGLETGGRPFVLEERHAWLRRVATSDLRDPTAFWGRMNALPTARAPTASAVAALAAAMPASVAIDRVCRRVAGMGSLGRPRFVALGQWGGGQIAREAKATAPSAWTWASGRAEAAGARRAAQTGVRVPDPTVHRAGAWLVRRLAPHCTRIELTELPRERDEERLLRAMGLETANLHLGTRGAQAALRRELRARPGAAWLDALARALAETVEQDWAEWRAR
jgi:uncharacterized protein (DUF2252 family)